MDTIRVAVYRVDQEMAVEEIPSGLQSYQRTVGGLFEQVRLVPGELMLVCNEEGIMRQLRPNRTCRLHNGVSLVIFGDFFVCRVSGDRYVGLTDDDIARLPALVDGRAESIVNICLMSGN